MLIKRCNLDKQGLELFVGPLEAKLLDVLWSAKKPLASKDIHRILLVDHAQQQAYNTIVTTLKRMAKKGLLKTIKRAVLHYTPAIQSEDDFIDYSVSLIATKLNEEYPDSAGAAFSVLMEQPTNDRS